MRFQVGTMEFMGHADLPQQAKHNAAVQALPYLHQMPDIKKASKVAAVPANNKKANTEAASVTPQGKNVIMVLNEIAMSQGVCMDWTMVDEDGPPHMRAFTWTLKMGSYEAVGSGNSKKLAKAIAAQNMYQVSFYPKIPSFRSLEFQTVSLPNQTIPEEWKNRVVNKNPRKKPQMKRKKPMPGSTTGIKVEPADVITSTNTTLDHIEIPGEKKLKTSVDGANAPTVAKVGAQAPIYSVIQTANPISALFEYCKKVKYPDPMFECKILMMTN